MASNTYLFERKKRIDVTNQKSLRMKTHIFSIICLLVVLFEGCDCACTYPTSLDGIFYSSKEGSLTWNATTFGTLTITTVTQSFSNLEFDCHLNDGNYYIGRSTSFLVYTAPFYAYICLELHPISNNAYYYYYATTELSGANGARVKILPTSTAVTSSSAICDESKPFQDGSFSILYKNGSSISTEATTCPSDIQGYYAYTLNDGTTTFCNSGSHLDVCADTKQLTFNYTECNATNVMYSASGELYCLHSQTSGSTHYVILYNNDDSVDDSTTYRTICMVYEKGSSGISYATQYPKECQNSTTMNATMVTSPGASLVLTENGSCPVTTTTTTSVIIATTEALKATETNTASVVGGTLAALILIAALVVVLIGVWYFMKKKKSGKVGKADDKVEIISESTGEDVIPKSHGETNSRTLFTPTNKIPTDDDDDVLSDRQITLMSGSIEDVEEAEQGDGQSLADEYGEIQADEIMIVSEKTTMSTDQMTEASLPMYSEAGDDETPAPTDDNANPTVVIEDVGEKDVKPDGTS